MSGVSYCACSVRCHVLRIQCWVSHVAHAASGPARWDPAYKYSLSVVWKHAWYAKEGVSFRMLRQWLMRSKLNGSCCMQYNTPVLHRRLVSCHVTLMPSCQVSATVYLLCPTLIFYFYVRVLCNAQVDNQGSVSPWQGGVTPISAVLRLTTGVTIGDRPNLASDCVTTLKTWS